MSDLPQSSKPKTSQSRPGPCPTNCGPVHKEGATLEEITCPCGYGYYDKWEKFINGSLVREGKAPSRAEYVAHVRQCDLQESGAPILRDRRMGEQTPGQVYLGAQGSRGVSGERKSAFTDGQMSS